MHSLVRAGGHDHHVFRLEADARDVAVVAARARVHSDDHLADAGSEGDPLIRHAVTVHARVGADSESVLGQGLNVIRTCSSEVR